MSKEDPIRDKYFKPLEIAETFSNILFASSALLSFVILIVNSVTQTMLYNIVQMIFAVSVLAFFICEILIRLYFAPRSQNKRYEDFLAHAFERQLSNAQTNGYYNSNASGVPKRIAAQLLENSFYSEDTASHMLIFERTKTIVYFFIWIILILNRNSNLAVIGLVVQIIFSEQIFSRWLRLEWLRFQFEKVYSEMFRLLNNNLDLELSTLEMLGRYEMAKANTGITLSSRVFTRRQKYTDAEWVRIKAILNL